MVAHTFELKRYAGTSGLETSESEGGALPLNRLPNKRFQGKNKDRAFSALGFSGTVSREIERKDEAEDIQDQVSIEEPTYITGSFTFSQTAVVDTNVSKGRIQSIEREVNYAPWLMDKVKDINYSSGYLKIRRNENLRKILLYVNGIIDNSNDNIAQLVNSVQLKNQINIIYKKFFNCGQEMHFLSILYMVENVFGKGIPEKPVLRETVKLFKALINKDRVTFNDYKVFGKRYFDLGIGTVSLGSQNIPLTNPE
jgi:hypothetical protein